MQYMSYDSGSDEDNDQPKETNKTEAPKDIASISTEIVDNADYNLPSEWLECSDSTSEEDNEVCDNSNEDDLKKEIASPKPLLDVNVLMSQVVDKPKFLKRATECDTFIIAETRNHSYDHSDSKYKHKTPTSSESDGHHRRTNAELKQPTKTTTVTAAMKKNDDSKKNVIDKETAKDRVKRQRLAGQSGVGADFKEWRSEEEMRQRQMYD